MGEIHYSRYFVHPGATKMYHDIREIYWWGEMKKDIAEFVAQCPNCQQVKIEHHRLSQTINFFSYDYVFLVLNKLIYAQKKFHIP